MARPVNEDEQVLQLKKRARRRLIGAIVLVCVVAVVLPMVLDSEPKRTSQEISIQIPSPDSKGFVSKVVPLTPVKGEKGEKGEVKPKPPAIAETPPTSEKPPAKIDTPPAKAEALKPTEIPKESAKSESGAFFVQVIALADAEKAKQVQQQIIDAGLKSYTEVVVAANGNVTRVRAGPFATRDEAEAARKQLLLSGLEGKVGTR
jgi:DedD protein